MYVYIYDYIYKHIFIHHLLPSTRFQRHRSILCSKNMKASPLVYFCYMICDNVFCRWPESRKQTGCVVSLPGKNNEKPQCYQKLKYKIWYIILHPQLEDIGGLWFIIGLIFAHPSPRGAALEHRKTPSSVRSALEVLSDRRGLSVPGSFRCQTLCHGQNTKLMNAKNTVDTLW